MFFTPGCARCRCTHANFKDKNHAVLPPRLIHWSFRFHWGQLSKKEALPMQCIYSCKTVGAMGVACMFNHA